MLTAYHHECLEYLKEKLDLTDIGDLANYPYFDKQIFMGACSRDSVKDDFTGQSIAVLQLKLDEALNLICGMQQGPRTNSVFDQDENKRLEDIIGQINIALKGTV